MTSHRTYCFVSAGLFAIVALAHGVRALAGWPLTIDTVAVPTAVSWIALVGAGALSAWGFGYAMRR